MRLQALHCPSCAAPLDVPVGAQRVTCAFCGMSLVVEAERVSTHRPAPAPRPEPEATAPFPEPDATLFSWEGQRFELSTIEQRIPGAVPEVFAGVELDGQRFALVVLRVVDKDGRALAHDLAPAFAALKASLVEDGDPGLAANLALETLCERPFTHRLECAVLLFEPRHMKVTTYVAGLRDAVVWASSEEGRCIVRGGSHDALERKFLREAREHFTNAEPLFLAAQDLVVVASAGFLGHGARGYGNGAHALHETVNEHLGEEPLRVVTLAKNAFWEDFQAHRSSRPTPAGDVKVVAVRAILPPAVAALPPGIRVEAFAAKRFELSALAGPADALALHPLHDERKVLVWLSPREGALAPGALATASKAVLAVLDRRDHGDNENPRQAGRDALAALGLPEGAVRLAVIQLFERWGRVKYFRAGWNQPIALGPRGGRGDSMQQFDEGGEATVDEGARLVFTGALSYDGDRPTLEAFGQAWVGGKASRLYEALRNHWKTKKSPAVLEAFARAAHADQPEAPLAGLAVVTGTSAS